MFSNDLITTLIGFLILIYSVILHEIAHGFVAEKLGDPTARRAGRLTLNPIPHIDPVMTVLVPAILYFSNRLFGTGIIFGAAKPVPVNPLYFDDPKKDIAIVSLAGVATNFSIAVIAALLFHLVGNTIPIIASILQSTVLLNLLLALFNILPIPPLDGSKVLASILPRQAAVTLLSFEPFGFFIIIALIYLAGLNSFLFSLIQIMMGLLHVPIG